VAKYEMPLGSSGMSKMQLVRSSEIENELFVELSDFTDCNEVDDSGADQGVFP